VHGSLVGEASSVNDGCRAEGTTVVLQIDWNLKLFGRKKNGFL
jgi:hypothetical protein